MRLRFKIEYDGSAFHGWQVQPNDHTVQAELEQAFSIALRAPIQVWGSGRTDAGVHARGQVAVAVNPEELNPEVNQPQDSTSIFAKVDSKKLTRSINGITNDKVFIRELEVCNDDFNPRFDAKDRYYIYTIFRRPVALGNKLGWDLSGYSLNPEIMQQEAQSFLGCHDFDPFSIPRNDGKSTDCTLFEFRLEVLDDRILMHIKGNRFLHRMVRSMVGILCDIGRGKHPLGTVKAIFNGEFKSERTWAPPHGLVLEKVDYSTY